MQHALMYYRRGKMIPNTIRKDRTYTFDKFERAFPGRIATAAEIAKEKAEIPPGFQMWIGKDGRLYTFNTQD